jgi:hypothetical protein
MKTYAPHANRVPGLPRVRSAMEMMETPPDPSSHIVDKFTGG